MKPRELVDIMEELGLLEYGSHISGNKFRALCGIESIENGNYSDFKRLELEELTYSGYVRNYLLSKGRYFKQERDSYRVLLPSENIEQVRAYMRAADHKLKRGIKLDKNTPTEFRDLGNNEFARMVIKRESIKEMSA
jgi:hypothetical protein